MDLGVKQKMNHTTNPSYRFIDSLTELERVCTALHGVRCVAVDVEADSMYHYREKVCLIQLATSQMSVVIDPLCLTDRSIRTQRISELIGRHNHSGSLLLIINYYRSSQKTCNSKSKNRIAKLLLP